MCGILGGYSTNFSESLLNNYKVALSHLNHRGPDDKGLENYQTTEGTFVLGQTRLAIIDLSDGGHQPMHSNCGRYILVYNGEIYNYIELREELKIDGFKFHTDSDTEVLIVAWAKWGVNSIKKLIGMFAFAVFDKFDNSVTLVRDPFGIKPLFYTMDSKGFAFASEINSLLVLKSNRSTLNYQTVYDYLAYGVQDKGSSTFIDGIYHVPPAHWVKFYTNANNKIETRKWWTPSFNLSSNLTYKQASEQLRHLFLDSVKLHLRSDVPIGIALSGGIDSSAIACGARLLDKSLELHTFSYISNDSKFSEEPWVDLVNQDIKAISHKVYITPNDLEKDILDIVQTQGEPFASTSMYAQYCVFKAASDAGIKVLLEGQGGDELLAGYNGYQGQRMHSMFEEKSFLKMQYFAVEWKKWH